MDVRLLTLAVGVLFAILLAVGRRQIARGRNSTVASGAVMMVLATIAGIWSLGLLVSWGGW